MSFWKDKVVLVTGGSAGLGRELAREFAARKARVVIVAREEKKLQEACEAIGQSGGHVRPAVADVTKQPEVDAVFQRVKQELGRLDALVNCAGKSDRGRVSETTPEAFDQLWRINFLGAVRCTRAALPQLHETKGHLVNIGSLASKVAARYLGAYPVSKFSLAAYNHQLRMEIGPEGIHVLLVCPGPIARGDAGQRYAEKTEGLPASAQQPGAGVRVPGIAPDRLARRIVRACERRQPELIVPGKARWLFAVSQLWPSFGDKIIRRMTT